MLKEQLLALAPQMAAAAQQVYDEWEQDEEGLDIEHGPGGICDRISQAITDVIVTNIGEVDILEGGQEGDDHAYIIAFNDSEAYMVDIPAGLYETGGGYSWQKIPDVEFTAHDVVVAPIDRADLALEEKISSALGLI
jgi:hypothetical protein